MKEVIVKEGAQERAVECLVYVDQYLDFIKLHAERVMSVAKGEIKEEGNILQFFALLAAKDMSLHSPVDMSRYIITGEIKDRQGFKVLGNIMDKISDMEKSIKH